MKPIVFIYNYQTLIAGAAALAGAWWTVKTIKSQIRQSDRQEEERLWRRNLAARAMMPVALTELCAYSQNCVNLLRLLIPEAPDEQRAIGELAEIPPIPSEALFTLRESVEFGGDQVAEAIADLIRNIQIQHARAISARGRLASRDKIVTRTNVVDYILDAVEVFARASKLFAYARRETNEAPGPLVCADVRTAAHNCDIWEEDGDIFARIPARYDDKRASGG